MHLKELEADDGKSRQIKLRCRNQLREELSDKCQVEGQHCLACSATPSEEFGKVTIDR